MREQRDAWEYYCHNADSYINKLQTACEMVYEELVFGGNWEDARCAINTVLGRKA
jgi:hypothetical protein